MSLFPLYIVGGLGLQNGSQVRRVPLSPPPTCPPCATPPPGSPSPLGSRPVLLTKAANAIFRKCELDHGVSISDFSVASRCSRRLTRSLPPFPPLSPAPPSVQGLKSQPPAAQPLLRTWAPASPCASDALAQLSVGTTLLQEAPVPISDPSLNHVSLSNTWSKISLLENRPELSGVFF